MSGAAFARVGGHTSCLALAAGDELPSLILDAGTGLQTLAPLFAGAPFDGAILLTHLHWDHMQGLPFFPPIDHAGARVTLAQPPQGDPLATLSRAMSPPHFPIGPEGLGGTWHHIALEPGVHDFGRFEVVARDVEHKGGRCYGYRVTCDGASLAYVPDALDSNDDAILELATGVDLFVRGTPFVTAERQRADEYGHGTAEHAAEIAHRAGVGRFAITHHSPVRSDDDVDKIAAGIGALALTEGMELDV